jgi:fructose-specific component phosphotransferase system IIB-like protein
MIALKNIILALPEPNLQTLEYLVRHLARVATHSHVNKMESANLAIVFGPTLIKPPVESMESVLNVGPQNSIVDALIMQVEWMFDKTS